MSKKIGLKAEVLLKFSSKSFKPISQSRYDSRVVKYRKKSFDNVHVYLMK